MSDGTKTVDMYCVKCREKVIVVAPKEVTIKSNRKALKGTCPHCGTGTYRLIKN